VGSAASGLQAIIYVRTCHFCEQVQQCLTLEEALAGEHVQQGRHHHTTSSIVAVQLPFSQTLQAHSKGSMGFIWLLTATALAWLLQKIHSRQAALAATSTDAGESPAALGHV
jgi:hypothetical protein